jgi:hypothetical protein
MLPPMRRSLLVAAVAVGAVAAALLVARQDGEDVAARVGDTTITEEDVSQTVDRINAELEREGRETAPEGSAGATRLRESALALLVYRARIEQGAAKLGIEVSADDVRARTSSGGEEQEAGLEPGAIEAVRTQLLYERIFERVTSGLVVTPAEIAAHRRPGVDDKTIQRELLAGKREAAMQAWLARTEKELPVRAS